MSVGTGGLILALLFYALFLLLVMAIVWFFPTSLLGKPAKAILNWLPPFLGGTPLRDWAAGTAEAMARKSIAGSRKDDIASRLAKDMEQAAMHAMLPLAEPADLERVVPCPETGQGRIGVTAPEALAIAAYIRKHNSEAEQHRIYESAVENARKIASRAPGDLSPYPCSLQGSDHVCCVFAHRPVLCRAMHAISITEEIARRDAQPLRPAVKLPDEPTNEQMVAQGIEAGVTRAMKSAGLDANIYELNSAIATALEVPDAAERWGRGENVFRNTLR